MTFSDLGLRSEVLKSLEKLGFESPTPIQEQAIPQLISEDRDLVGLAQTGTGKTAAFGLPLLEFIDFDQKKIQGLVIAPTRELGMQIASDLRKFSEGIQNAKIAAIYGGASIDKQASDIKKGAQIVVATPGRLMDMMRRGIIKLGQVKKVVLDEADEMLNMGFKEDIDGILSETPGSKNVWLFSATMPKEVARIAKNYMEDPIEISIAKNTSAANLDHVYYQIRERDRYPALKRILDYYPDIYGVIFCRTKRLTQEVADKLMQEGYNAEPLHGDMSQMQRDAVMKKYRDKSLQILVATDVAARGIDVDNITHVINYNLPEDVESYTHRSGRTARAGRHGISIALVSPRDSGKIKVLERIIKKEFIKGEIPSGKEVCQRQLMSIVNKIENVEVKDDEIQDYLPEIMEKLGHLTSEELIKKFVSFEFNAFLDYYADSFNLNADFKNDRGGRSGGRSERDSNMQRFHINLGEKNGLNKGAVTRIVCEESGLKSSKIGRIDMYKDFCFFEVDKSLSDQVMSGMQNIDFEGRTISVEKAKEQGGSKGRGRGRGRGNGGRGNGGHRRGGGGGGNRNRGAASRRRRK